MNHIQSIKSFEAITPERYRKFHKEGIKGNYKERYKDIFLKYKKLYDGDRNAFRIYLPLVELIDKSEIQIEVERFMKEMGIDVDSADQFNYKEGKYKFSAAKNWVGIGRALSKAKKQDLMNRFASDKTRILKGGKEDLIVCISRHPYDIAGADTDRRWVNCMTMYHYNRFTKAWMASGNNTRFLAKDVKLGSLVAFLIRKDDRNIQDPLSNLNIKPYINDEDPSDIVLIPDNRVYGLADEDFKSTIFNWCDEINGEKIGRYKIAKGLYQDNLERSEDALGSDDEDPNFGYALKHLPKE